MDRLTERDEYGNADIIGVDSADIQLNLGFDDFNKVKNALNKLADYEDAREQGLFIKLPCKVGDTVYTNRSMQGWYLREKDRPYKARVVFIGINGVDNFINVELKEDFMLQFKFTDIGKTVFLTREEAEAKIAEFRGKYERY